LNTFRLGLPGVRARAKSEAFIIGKKQTKAEDAVQAYINYISSYYPEDMKPCFFSGRSVAITRINAYLGGNVLRTGLYYHFISLTDDAPPLIDRQQVFRYGKNYLVMLPPEREYAIQGSLACCCPQYYLIVKKTMMERIAIEFNGVGFDGRIIARSIQPQASDILQRIVDELREKAFGYESVTYHLVSILVAHMLRGDKAQCALMQDTAISQACEYIHAYFDSVISIDELASIANMSKYHFLREFKKAMGQTPYSYIQRQRLNKAKELLLGTDNSVADIARLCGFVNASHFSYATKKHFGSTPTALRTSKSNNKTEKL